MFDISNYRLISILPVFSKPLEKLLHQRLLTHPDKHALISESQFEFRKHRSTEIALLNQKELIVKAFDEKKITLGVFLDFSKAFDSINDDILLAKPFYGIRGIALGILKSYLLNRNHYVYFKFSFR